MLNEHVRSFFRPFFDWYIDASILYMDTWIDGCVDRINRQNPEKSKIKILTETKQRLIRWGLGIFWYVLNQQVSISILEKSKNYSAV